MRDPSWSLHVPSCAVPALAAVCAADRDRDRGLGDRLLQLRAAALPAALLDDHALERVHCHRGACHLRHPLAGERLREPAGRAGDPAIQAPVRVGDDILLLADHFNELYSQKYMKPQLPFDKSAREKLLSYPFPGNVRELQYTIERAVIMAEGDELKAADLLFSPIEFAPEEGEEPKETNLSTVEKNTILKVIEKHNGNITKAAKELGLTRTALYRRLSKYDI